ncbi:MAG: 50S ribosomal protein L4 [bacterium]
MAQTSRKAAAIKVAKTEKVVKAKKEKVVAPLEGTIYDVGGNSAGTVALPKEIFGIPWNADLVAQVVNSIRSAARQPLAHTKDRSEVAGGGKKPWKQKGTGQARHGSSRSPIWVGGGVAHGPRKEKNYDRKVNKKMKAKALFTILSAKWRDGEILFVKNLELVEPKTKLALAMIDRLSNVKGFDKLATKKKNAALITVPALEENVKRGFSNLGSFEISELRNINPISLLQHKYLVIASPEDAFVTLMSKIK